MSGMPQESGCDPGLAVCLASSFFGHYAHLGLLSAMEDAGLRPGRIAGASAGAMAGGMWAAGLRGEALERVIYDFHFRRVFSDIGALYRLPGIASGLAGSGLFSGVRIRRYLTRVLGSGRIEDLQGTRLEIAVCNLSKKRGEIRTRGPLVDFIIASCAMPVLFKPQKIGGEEFLDGGVANETPFEHWLEDPSVHTVVVHRIVHDSGMKGLPWRSPGAVLGACHSLVAEELLIRRTEKAQASGKRLFFLETRHAHPGLLHGGKSRGFFSAGQETFRKSPLAASPTTPGMEIPLFPGGRAS